MYVLAASSLAMAVVMVLYVNRYDLDTEERNLNAALLRAGNNGFTDDELRPMLERHPAAWYLPFLAGVDRFKTGRGNPLPWLARALEINPSSASAHLYVGRTLLRTGHLDQAMLEFRLASRSNPTFARPAARYLVSAGARFESLAKMAVDKEDKALLWAALADEFACRNMDEEALAADLAVISLRPPGHRSLARHARRLSARHKIPEALKLAHRLGALADRGPAAALLESEIHHKAGDHEKEISSLTSALEKTPDHPMLLRNLARAHNRAGEREAARKILGRLKGISTNTRARASVAIMEGDFERSNGRFRAALACYRQAFALTPTDTRLLAKIADLAQANGDNASALDALRKMVDLEPGDEKWKKRLDDLEKKLKLKSAFHE
jgi:tetratricopeptide (TPR) repeat protein